MKTRFYSVIALLAFCFNVQALAAVTATVNKNNLAPGDTLQLRIQRDGSADGQPDLSALKKDFDVLGSSRGSNVQIINGQMSTQTQVTVLLAPKRTGKIQIPPLQWGNEHSASIELTVGVNGGGGAAQQGGAQKADDNSLVYLTTTLDQKQPYVQAAVVLTVRLHAGESLYQASLDFPASSDVLIKPLGKDVQTNETRNGREFQIIERKYLLFPQRSGKLSLNGPVLDAQIPDNNRKDPFDHIFRQMPFGGMVNATRPIRVRAKPIELNVLPRPASAGSTAWLPAQKVTLEENWRPDMSTIHIGEPLTRQFRLEALGLTGAQLPDPSSFMTVPEGIKAYPDQAKVTDKPQGNSVLGSRDQNIALIASRTGRYELPAVHLSWWDTTRNEKREIILPAHTLEVLPAVAGSSAMTMSPVGTESSLLLPQGEQSNAIGQVGKFANNPVWMWLSLILGILWLGTSVAWWRARHRVHAQRPEKIVAEKKNVPSRGGSEFKALKLACLNNDPQAARQHMLAWAGTIWPDAPPRGLNELAHQYEDANFVEALRQLDRACYTGGTWYGALLLKSLPNAPIQAAAKESKHVLPQLYQ